MVAGLAVTELVSWGVLVYAFSVVVVPSERIETVTARTQAAYSCSLGPRRDRVVSVSTGPTTRMLSAESAYATTLTGAMFGPIDSLSSGGVVQGPSSAVGLLTRAMAASCLDVDIVRPPAGLPAHHACVEDPSRHRAIRCGVPVDQPRGRAGAEHGTEHVAQ
jgi:hypothetical protein